MYNAIVTHPPHAQPRSSASQFTNFFNFSCVRAIKFFSYNFFQTILQVYYNFKIFKLCSTTEQMDLFIFIYSIISFPLSHNGFPDIDQEPILRLWVTTPALQKFTAQLIAWRVFNNKKYFSLT
jgi:hypothetical protein